MKAVVKYSWRVVLAAALLTGISFLSYNARYRFQGFSQVGTDAAVVLGWLCLSKSLVTLSLAYLTIRSRWWGTQLMAALFVAHFGIDSFINQLRAVFLAPGRIALSTVALLTAHGFLMALLFSFVLVVLMGRTRDPGLVVESARLHLPAREWLSKLALCAAGWLALCFCLCGPVGLAPLWQRIGVQVARAVLVVVFVLPVIKMLKGGRLEAALAVAVLLLALGSIAPTVSRRLLLEEQVSLGRAVGRGVADFTYGALVGFLFSRESGRP